MEKKYKTLIKLLIIVMTALILLSCGGAEESCDDIVCEGYAMECKKVGEKATCGCLEGFYQSIYTNECWLNLNCDAQDYCAAMPNYHCNKFPENEYALCNCDYGFMPDDDGICQPSMFSFQTIENDIEKYGIKLKPESDGVTLFSVSTGNLSIRKIDQMGNLSDFVSSDLEKTNVLSIVDDGDNLYIAGRSWNLFDGYQFTKDVSIVAKLTFDGELIWAVPVDADDEKEDEVKAINIDGDGSLYITTFTSSRISSSFNKTSITKLDNDGNILWNRKEAVIGTPDSVYPSRIAIKDDKIFVLSYRGRKSNVYIYNSENGEDINKFTVGDDNELSYYKKGQFLIDTKGNLVVVGLVDLKGEEDMFVTKYDQDGNQIWLKSFGAKNVDDDDYARDIMLDKDGNLLVLGWTEGEMPGEKKHGCFENNYKCGDIVVIKMNPDGEVIWIKQFGRLYNDLPRTMTVTDDNMMYISGRYDGLHMNNAFVAKLDLNQVEKEK